MRKNAIIRAFQMQDVEALCPLYNQLGYPVSASLLVRRLTKLLAQDGYHLLVAAVDREIVAFIGFTKMYMFEADQTYMRILALVVDESHRRQGIAGELLAQVKQIAKEEGASFLALNSGISDERLAAHQFYEKQGFKRTSYGFKSKL